MKKGILIILVNLIALNVFSQTKNFIDQPYIETRIKVDTLVTPDKIYLNILITEKDTKGKISVEELENKMADKLVDLGINLEKQLSLKDVASNFKKYFLKRQDILKSNAYSLIVYSGLSVGEVIVGLEQIGISNVQLVRAEYSAIEQLKLKLKSKAVYKAKLQAETMLKPLNQQLGNAIHISDMNFYMSNRFQGRVNEIQVAYSKESQDNNMPVAIEFEKIKVESEIAVKFKIE